MRPREAALLSHYDNLGYYSPLDYLTFAEICAAVDTVPKPPILDLGCGDGRLARRTGLDVTGVDYNQQRADVAGAVCADLYEYLETAPHYPQTVFIEVLEHLEEPELAVKLARAVSDETVATVPIDLEYEAHLQYFADMDAVVIQLAPDRCAQIGRHAALYWGYD